jgi:uncharacterized protein (TIGR03437 family)
LTVTTPYGSSSRSVAVQPAAPEIFLVSATLGAILNQDQTLNSPANPATRGQAIVIYATGLAPSLSAPVTVIVNGTSLKPFYAGPAPGFAGLDQVNVIVPPNTPPGLAIPVSIQQQGAASNTVSVAIQ